MCCSIKKVSATVTICTGISRIRPQCPYNSEVAFCKVITNNKGGELIPMSTTTTTTMATHDYRIRLQCDPMTILMIVVSKYIQKKYIIFQFFIWNIYIYISTFFRLLFMFKNSSKYYIYSVSVSIIFFIGFVIVFIFYFLQFHYYFKIFDASKKSMLW